LLLATTLMLENGYDLWLRYQRIENTECVMQYTNKFARITLLGKSETIQVINFDLTGLCHLCSGRRVVVYPSTKNLCWQYVK
jgi:alpha-glucuronidase